MYVGDNPQSESTWEPLVKLIWKKLDHGKHRYVILSGIVTLLNYVLNDILVFYIFFIKMTMKIWMKLIRIRRRFLWGSVKGESKISWVRWYEPKKAGGLGVKDIQMVNLALALLDKWRWRLLEGASGIWADILFVIYGHSIVTSLHGGRALWSRYVSLWWKGVSLIGSKKEKPLN